MSCVFGQMEQSLAGNQKELELVERELQQMEVSSHFYVHNMYVLTLMLVVNSKVFSRKCI